MENKKVLKLTDFQKNEENPFMKQAIEGYATHSRTKDEVNDRQYYRSVILVFISVICIIKSWIRTANFTLSESS